MENKVFVYGSLQRGSGNHRIIKRYVRSAHNAIMRGWMFNVGYYPAVVQGCGLIHGQLLELEHPEKAFSAMDILEGFQEPEHPRNLYERVATTVTLENGESLQCLSYIFHERKKEELSRTATFMPNGVWERSADQDLRLYLNVGSRNNEVTAGIQVGYAISDSQDEVPVEGNLYLLSDTHAVPPKSRRVDIIVAIDGLRLPAFTYIAET